MDGNCSNSSQDFHISLFAQCPATCPACTTSATHGLLNPVRPGGAVNSHAASIEGPPLDRDAYLNLFPDLSPFISQPQECGRSLVKGNPQYSGGRSNSPYESYVTWMSRPDTDMVKAKDRARAERRRALNRTAQRRFRQRQDLRVQTLKNDYAKLETEHQELKTQFANQTEQMQAFAGVIQNLVWDRGSMAFEERLGSRKEPSRDKMVAWGDVNSQSGDLQNVLRQGLVRLSQTRTAGMMRA